MTLSAREREIAYQTSFFAGGQRRPASPSSSTPRMSARSAFQQALYGYRLLVDIRPGWQRELTGEVVEGVHTVVVDITDLPWLAAALAGSRPILMCQQGTASIRLADGVARFGVGEVADVIGGFDAWLAAGLPVR